MQTKDQQYFYAIQGKRHGPVSFDVLRSMAEKQELGRADKIWGKGMSEWQQAGSLADLFDGLPPEIPDDAGPDVSFRAGQESEAHTPRLPDPAPGLVAVAAQNGNRSETSPVPLEGYWLEFNGNKVGPFSLSELLRKLDNNSLRSEDRVWVPGNDVSAAAGTLRDLEVQRQPACVAAQRQISTDARLADSTLPEPSHFFRIPQNSRPIVGGVATLLILGSTFFSAPALKEVLGTRSNPTHEVQAETQQGPQPDLATLKGHAAQLEAQMETNLRSGLCDLRIDDSGVPYLGEVKDIQRYWKTVNYEAGHLRDLYGHIKKQDAYAQKDLARIEWTLSVLDQALKWRSRLGDRRHPAWTSKDKETARSFMIAANSLAEAIGRERPFRTVGFNVPEAVLAARNSHLNPTAGVKRDSFSVAPVTWEAIEQLVRLCGQDITGMRFFRANPGADGWLVVTNEPVCPPFSRTYFRWNTANGRIAAVAVEMRLTEPDVVSRECDPYLISVRELTKRFGSPDPSISEHRPGYDKEDWLDVLGVGVSISRWQSEMAPRETHYRISAMKGIEVEALGSGGDGTLSATSVYNTGYERGAFGSLFDQATAADQADCIRRGLPVKPATVIYRKTLREASEERIKAGDVTYAEEYARGYVKGYADQEAGAYAGSYAANAAPSGQSQRDACIENLRNLDGAVQMYRLEQGMDRTVTAAQLTSGSPPILKAIPRCPTGGKYSFGNSPLPSCSIPDHQSYWESCNIR